MTKKKNNEVAEDIPAPIPVEIPEGHVRVKASGAFSAANIVLQHMARNDLPGNVAYKLSRLASALEPEANAYKEGLKRLEEEHAWRDENSDLILPRNEKGEPVPQFQVDPENRADYDEAENLFADTLVDIKWNKNLLKGTDLADHNRGKKKEKVTAETPVPAGGTTFFHVGPFMDMSDYQEDDEKDDD